MRYQGGMGRNGGRGGKGRRGLSLFVLILGFVTVGVGAQAPNEAALAKLEAAVAAAPDDMRAGNDYRMTVVAAAGDRSTVLYDRAIAFFEKLVTDHPDAANAHLNYGFAYVDKIPAAGTITQVILANNALGEFTKSLELRPSWIGFYTRGNSYLFWPRIFGRTKYGITDLEEALKIQRAGPKHPYYVRVYISLGDGHWKMDELDQAVAIWKEGLAQFPDNQVLKGRLGAEGDALKALIDSAYDPAKRVSTSLQDLWTN
jgi:tetratricopeptide (TPR) repeat protein